jgi:hypothetical protein
MESLEALWRAYLLVRLQDVFPYQVMGVRVVVACCLHVVQLPIRVVVGERCFHTGQQIRVGLVYQLVHIVNEFVVVRELFLLHQ